MNKEIYVFEHQFLRVSRENEQGSISQDDFEALKRFHSRVSDKFFSIYEKKVKFNHYVGVIHIGKKSIKVLPKIGTEDDEIKWSNALTRMVKVARKVSSKKSNQEPVKAKNLDPLDLYIQEFLLKVDELIHSGLRKKYIKNEKNMSGIKGRIVFSRDASLNYADKTKKYCRYQDYTFDHSLNKIIHHGLSLIQHSTSNSELKSWANRHLLYFEDLCENRSTSKERSRYTLGRNEIHYKDGLSLAILIIDSFCPQMSRGEKNVICFLFDMNKLFEEYVFRLATRKLKPLGWEVHRRGKEFWNSKRIYPDLVLKKESNVIVLDTKWKMPRDSKPDDGDLKQIFVYNHYYDSPKSYLLYPETGENESVITGNYNTYQKQAYDELQCNLAFLPLFDGDSLSDFKTVEFLKNLVKESEDQ